MKLAAILVGVVIAASIAWFASEQHYSNCLDSARAQNPLGEAGLTAADRRDQVSWFEDQTKRVNAEVEARPAKRRQAALAGCSRVPW